MTGVILITIYLGLSRCQMLGEAPYMRYLISFSQPYAGTHYFFSHEKIEAQGD